MLLLKQTYLILNIRNLTIRSIAGCVVNMDSESRREVGGANKSFGGLLSIFAFVIAMMYECKNFN